VSRPGKLALTTVAMGMIAIGQVGLIRDGAPRSFVLTDLGVAVAFVVGGIGAWRLTRQARLGTACLLGAVAWQMGTLAMSTRDSSVTFVLGAISGYHELALAFLLVAYPTGVLSGRASRLVVAVLAGGLLAGTVVRLTMVQPDEWGCIDCPHNPFALATDEAAFVSAQDWVGRLLGGTVLAIAVITIGRWVSRSVPARRAAGVLPFAGAVWALLYAQDTWLRPIDTLVIDDPTAFYVLAAARGAIPLGVVSGLTWVRLRQSRLADLFAGVDEGVRRDELEPALRSVLGDPGVELWWSVAGRGGFARSARPEDVRVSIEPGRDQVVTVLHANDGDALGLLRHDASLLDDDRFATSVRSAVRLIADHDRLAAQVRDQLDEVRASRSRILAAAASERARLERDLHDGSQQRLVGLALQLRMAQAIVDEDQSPALAQALALATKELAEAIADLRELARGIHPVALTDGGLPAALPLLADRTPIPATISIEIEARLAPEIESTLYFVAAEALTNVVKHADAHSCTVDLRHADGAAVLTVTDDGRGGAEGRSGGGLLGLRDRVEAVGGSLSIVSDPDRGTSLIAAVPASIERRVDRV
jgi:signal transduction histidine kinase